MALTGMMRLFSKKFCFFLPDLNSNQLILGGDFNCCLDPLLDRSSSRPCAQSKSSRMIQLFMEQYAISDVFLILAQKSFLSFPLYITLSPALIIFLLITNCFHWLAHVSIILLLFQTMLLLHLTSLYQAFQCPGLLGVLTLCFSMILILFLLLTTVLTFLSPQIFPLTFQLRQSGRHDFVKFLTTKTEFDLLTTNEATEALHKTHCNYYEFGDKSVASVCCLTSHYSNFHLRWVFS